MKNRIFRFMKGMKTRLLSIPIFYKILLIQVFTGMIQSVITLYQIKSIVAKSHEGLGVSQEIVENELKTITKLYVVSLSISMIIETLIFLILAFLLTNPIRNLVKAATLINKGNLKTRIKVIALDEIGRLGASFNRMVIGLERFRQNMLDKEKARVSLIDQILVMQERDRQQIARELHDQLGQSLSAMLLEIKTCTLQCSDSPTIMENLEKQTKEIMADVHRLAYAGKRA